MKKIEVAVIGHSMEAPADMMLFLAKLTQRGHNIKSMTDLIALQQSCSSAKDATIIRNIAALPHGTIKRMTPITIAIVGASRRFLMQARTHQVGITYVSASMQYSDYTDAADFVVPYSLTHFDHVLEKGGDMPYYTKTYIDSCATSMNIYKDLADLTDNDTAGYAAPHGLRNILIMQGNHDSWCHFLRMRGCNRNTVETQYVTMLIWDALLRTVDGTEMFAHAGPDCVSGSCREGRFCCGKYVISEEVQAHMNNGYTVPMAIVKDKWPLLGGEV